MSYATSAQLKAYLGLTTATDDGLLDGFLARAQKLVETTTGRTFEATSNSTRYFDAVADVDGAVLRLDMDLCSINTITNGDGVVVASNERVTEPRNEAPFYAVRLLGTSGKAWTYTTDPENAIAISGKWAYSTSAPADIVQATLRLAAWMYRQKDSGVDGDRVLSADGVLIMPASLPNDVQAMLKPYVRKVFR